MKAVTGFVVASVTVMLLTSHASARQEQIKPQPAPRDSAAPQRPGTAVLAGRLVVADSGKPVRRANVSLTGAEGTRKSATTDENGAFSFTELPPGSFTLAATRAGYLDVTFGQRTPGSGRPGTPIQLVAGQKLNDVTLRMPRTGIITGVVTDEFGDPVMGVQVRAWRAVRRSGERTLVMAGNGSTDDRGIYRLAGMIPGEYVVVTGARETSETMMLELTKMREAAEHLAVASGATHAGEWSYAVPAIRGSSPQSTSGYPSIYFPGTMQSSGATPVTIGISEERSGVDIQLQVAPLATITGSVVGPDGNLPPGGEVRLSEAGSTLPTARVFSGPIRRDGTFTISGVPPGQYTLSARTNQRVGMRLAFDSSGAGVESKEVIVRNFEMARETFVDAQVAAAAEPLWGQTDLAVDGRPLSNLVLPLRKGYDVSGTFGFEGTPPQPPELSRVRVQLQPMGAGAENAPVTSGTYTAGKFTLRGVTPGRYRLTASGLPSGWTLKSATFGGRDVLDTMLDVTGGDELASGVVTFTKAATELSGTLQDNSGKPISDFTIVVFPSDRRFWMPMSRRIQATRPGTDGRFSFRNLPEGDYRLIAVIDPEPGDWFDPAFLDQLLGAAMPISLNDGERKVQDVRVAR